MKSRLYLRARHIWIIFSTCVLFAAPIARAQIISNGTNIGTNITGLSLVPISGTGTLLISSDSAINKTSTTDTPSLLVNSNVSGSFFITNNGLVTNNGTGSKSQAVDFQNVGNYTLVNGSNGVLSIKSTSIYEVLRSAQTTNARVGVITNYGLIEGLGSGAVVTFSYGKFEFNNEGTVRGGFGYWANNGSMTINQLSGEITANTATNFANSIYTAARTNLINVSGGKITKDLFFDGLNSVSSVNLSGGQINGNLLFNRSASTNNVLVTGGSLNGDVRFSNSVGAVNFDRGDAYTYTNVISGSGRVTNSSGATTLTRTNTYTGTTTVAGGGLIVNGAIASSATTVQSGGTLSGTGTVGALTVQSGGTVSPGNSPGKLNINGDINWLGGGNYNWQVLDTAGTAGITWDLLYATGKLNLSSLSVSSQFNINLWSLTSAAPDVEGLIANFDNTQSYSWTIVTATNGILGYTGTEQFNVNVGAANGAGGFANALQPGWGFRVLRDGNNLNLVYGEAVAPAVPEPGTWGAAALLIAGAVFARWRKRTKVA